MSLLKINSLQLCVGDKLVCDGLDLSIDPGESLGILGRNGVGKTSLLYAILALRPVTRGHISLQDVDVRLISRLQMAQRAGMLLQEPESTMPATVFESVMLGRYPHSGARFWDSSLERELVIRALEAVGLYHLQARQLDTLSGGERQKVAVALLLVQSPGLYLLDEPSNHLDIDSQIKLLSLIRQVARDNNGAMVMASHDINLTWRFCDLVLLMLGDGDWLFGDREQVMTSANLTRAFGCEIRKLSHDEVCHFFPA